jgi:SSS family solute:Na+ symporter
MTVLAVIAAYLLLVLAIGTFSHRLFRGSGEDYFVATRTIGPFVLLMTLFGTNMTAFSMLGASGEAYHRGIGVFALMASSTAIVSPVFIYFLGPRIWALGKRHGYLTQVEYFRDRWGSSGLGTLLFLVLVGLLIPYLLIGVKGGGITLAQITGNLVPEWTGSLAMCVVVLTYVTVGGMRGTAWANTFQTLVFMSLGGLAFYVIVRNSGGLAGALESVALTRPELLARGDLISPVKLLSYTVIPMSIGMFPHIYAHWLTAKSAQSFKLPIVAYPICLAIVWVPSVLLGVIGAAQVSGLEGPAANTILVQLINLHAPEVLAGLLAAGVFAAVMSSLDSQTLAISTMFTRDVVGHSTGGTMDDRRQVLLGRLFVTAVLLVTFALSLAVNRSIFALGVWSFSGFAALAPLPFAALFWKRSTAVGAYASILTVATLWIFFFLRGNDQPGYTVGGTGLMPVVVMLGASIVAMVVGSLLSSPPDDRRLEKFFPAAPGAGAGP